MWILGDCAAVYRRHWAVVDVWALWRAPCCGILGYVRQNKFLVVFEFRRAEVSYTRNRAEKIPLENEGGVRASP